MRKAAGIILVISGVFGVVAPIGLIIAGGHLGCPLNWVPFMLWRTAYAVFLITGGSFCLRRKYWKVCLASASFGVLVGVLDLAEWRLAFGRYSTGWDIWIPLIAGVIAAIFIAVTKKEWQVISDSVDGKVSYGG